MLNMISEGSIKITETVSEGSVFVNQSDCLILESLLTQLMNKRKRADLIIWP